MKSWDSTLKRLVKADPPAFVQWLLPEAVFLEELPVEIESLHREVDALLTVTVKDQRMLLHIEFQTYNDPTMARRLMTYNTLLMETYQLPVLSCVIYLLQDGTVSQSPLDLFVPTGYRVHTFYFESIEIGRLTAEDLFSIGSDTLLALVPLAEDGTQHSVLTQVFEQLGKQREPAQAETQATEVEVIAFTLASFVLQKRNKTADLEWLVRRFREMHDIIQDSPIFQEILREGMEKGMEEGMEKGIEKGIEKGRLDAARHILLIVTEKRFSGLASLAQEQVARMQDLNAIDNLIVAISAAANELEAYNALRSYK